jgi:hypothetical protein
MPLNKLQKSLNVNAEQLQNVTMTKIKQPDANTAETVVIPIPVNNLLYAIALYVDTNLTGTIASVDGINEVRLIIDGNKIVKKIRGGMLKALQIFKGAVPSTGYYMLYIADPDIGSDPLPLWGTTTCSMEVDVIASGTASMYVEITPTLISGTKASYPSMSNPSLANVLFEKYLTQIAYGANTGAQQYIHERTHGVFQYIYEFENNNVLSDTCIDWLTLQLNSQNGTLQPYYQVSYITLKEDNKQEALGNAQPTGYLILTFPQALQAAKYTSIYSYLDVPSALTNFQVRVCERYVIGAS